jgi:hypothetical protein
MKKRLNIDNMSFEVKQNKKKKWEVFKLSEDNGSLKVGKKKYKHGDTIDEKEIATGAYNKLVELNILIEDGV